MYESSTHSGSRGHSDTCAECRKTWQPNDFLPAIDRILATPRVRRDPMVGAEVVASTARTERLDRTTNVAGQVWSQADPTMIGSRKARAYWIADGDNFYVAHADDLQLVSDAIAVA